MSTFDPASTEQTSGQEPNVGDESLSILASPSSDKKEIVSETAIEATEAASELPPAPKSMIQTWLQNFVIFSLY